MLQYLPMSLVLGGTLLFLGGIFSESSDMMVFGWFLAVSGAIVRRSMFRPEAKPPVQ